MATSNKQVCRFFLEGRCRFGSNCRFYHPTDSSGYGNRGGGSNRNNQARGGYRGQSNPQYKDLGRGWGQREQGGNRYQLFSENDDFRDDSRGYQGGYQGGRGRGGQRGSRQGYRNNSRQNDSRYDSSEQFGNSGDTSHRGNPFDRLGPRNSDSNYSRGGGNYGRGGNFGGRSRDYGASSQDDSSSTTSLKDIATIIRNDMEEWINSSAATMWLLSCYSHTKELAPCLPGLVDISPDELRWEAYQAKVTGSSSKYLQGLSELSEKQMKMQRQYGHITAEDVRLLQSNPEAVLSDSTSLFGGTNVDNSSGGGLFGPSTSGPSVSSMFGGSGTSSNLFGPANSTSTRQINSQPLFGTSDSGPLTTSSIFGGQGSTTQSSQDTKTTGSLFGPLSSQPNCAQTVITASPNPVVTQTQVSTPIPGKQTDSSAGHKTLRDILNYTQTRELTKLELEGYNADKFVLGQIPEHAPIIV